MNAKLENRIDFDLLVRFEAGTVLPQEFHHRQHVQVVWLYLQRYAVTEVLVRFPAALQSFARRVGKPNLYHATITWAYILLVNERIERARLADRSIATFDQFAAANPDLLAWKPSILERYYSNEVLADSAARATFIFPESLAK